MAAATVLVASPAHADVKLAGGNAWDASATGTLATLPFALGPFAEVRNGSGGGPGLPAPGTYDDTGAGGSAGPISIGVGAAHNEAAIGVGGFSESTADVASVGVGGVLGLALTGVHSECRADESGFTASSLITTATFGGLPITLPAPGVGLVLTLPTGGTITLFVDEQVNNSGVHSFGHVNAARIVLSVPLVGTSITVVAAHSHCFTRNRP